MEKYNNNPIWQLIICVEKKSNTEATHKCDAATSECEEIENTINRQHENIKAVTDLMSFISAVKKRQFKSAETQLKAVKEEFIKYIVPHYERQVKDKPKGKSQQESEPKSTSKSTSSTNESVIEIREDVKSTAGRFRDIFDGDVWSDAHEHLSAQGFSEKDNATILLEIVQRAFKFNEEEAKQQILEATNCAYSIIKTGKPQTSSFGEKDVSKAPVELLRRYMYLNAGLSLPRLEKVFLEVNMNKVCTKHSLKRCQAIDKYATSCIKITWRLCTEDPPVHMVFGNDGDNFDSDMYDEYTRRGKKIDFIVWPPLRHYENGPVLAKGIAEC